MTTLKSRFSAGVLVVAAGLSCVGMALAQDNRIDDGLRSSLASDDIPTVVIHKGVVIGTGPRGVFSHDIASGLVSVRNRDGARFDYWLTPGILPKEFPELVWVGFEQSDDVGVRAKSCNSQAETLGRAIAGVSSACGGAGSRTTCAAAIDFYFQARNDYESCLRTYLK